MQRVLIATDGSPSSTEAIHHVASLLNPDVCRLNILTVVPPSGASALSYALQTVERAVTELRAKGFSISTLVRVGRPAEVIVAVARDLGVDLIVMGTRGRQGGDPESLSSVATRVCQVASCGVMVFPLTATTAPALAS